MNGSKDVIKTPSNIKNKSKEKKEGKKEEKQSQKVKDKKSDQGDGYNVQKYRRKNSGKDQNKNIDSKSNQNKNIDSKSNQNKNTKEILRKNLKNVKSEEGSKRCRFIQGSKCSLRSGPDFGRIEELSKPSKSTLLNTWKNYSNVFDYERMRRLMHKLHLEFSLTPEEKRLCMEQLRKNAEDLHERLSMGSTDEIRRLKLKTIDIQKLSTIVKPPKIIRSSRRTEELACPKPYKILATWNEFGGILPVDKRIKFHRKYVESVARITNSERKIHQRRQSRKITYNSLKTSNLIVEEQEKLMAREAAYKLVEKGVERAVIYAQEGRPPPLMNRTLIKLSDNILSVLSDKHLIKIPSRDSHKRNAKFLLYVADWTAKIISDAYLATEKFDFGQKVFARRYLKGGGDKGVQETILEQDETQDSIKEENEMCKEVVKINIKEIIEKNEEIENQENNLNNRQDLNEDNKEDFKENDEENLRKNDKQDDKQNDKQEGKQNDNQDDKQDDKLDDKQVDNQDEDKPFEEISEIDNSFGNESDWDDEDGILRQEVKHEVKKLTITNSKTEIIHIRNVEAEEPDESKKEVDVTESEQLSGSENVVRGENIGDGVKEGNGDVKNSNEDVKNQNEDVKNQNEDVKNLNGEIKNLNEEVKNLNKDKKRCKVLEEGDKLLKDNNTDVHIDG